MLHGKFVNVTDFLANFVGILAYLRVNQFGINLCGENGLMPQHFLKGFQRHSLKYGQNGKCVAPDMKKKKLYEQQIREESITQFAVCQLISLYSST